MIITKLTRLDTQEEFEQWVHNKFEKSVEQIKNDPPPPYNCFCDEPILRETYVVMNDETDYQIKVDKRKLRNAQRVTINLMEIEGVYKGEDLYGNNIAIESHKGWSIEDGKYIYTNEDIIIY